MTAQEVIKEIMAHIAMLEMNEAMDALLDGTEGDAGYVKALNDMRDFIKERFRDDTETTYNQNEKETLGAHLRNLLTPYSLLIELHNDGRDISEFAFDIAETNLSALLKFADSQEMQHLRNKTSDEKTQEYGTEEIH